MYTCLELQWWPLSRMVIAQQAAVAPARQHTRVFELQGRCQACVLFAHGFGTLFIFSLFCEKDEYC